MKPASMPEVAHPEGLSAETELLIKSMQGVSEYQAYVQLRQLEGGVVLRNQLRKALRGWYCIFNTTITITKLKMCQGVRYFIRDTRTGFTAQLTVTKTALVMVLTGMSL